MESRKVYQVNKEIFIYKINNKKYLTVASLNFDYGRLLGMLSILLLSDFIDSKKYNKEVSFLDSLALNYLPKKEVLK